MGELYFDLSVFVFYCALNLTLPERAQPLFLAGQRFIPARKLHCFDEPGVPATVRFGPNASLSRFAKHV